MSVLFNLMYASTIFEHSLSIMFRVDFVAAAVRNFGESGNHGSVVLGGHSMNKYGIKIVDVCNKYVLHGFEGVDRDRTW
jgi:hypothetical protein